MTCHEDRSLQSSTGKPLFVDLAAFKNSLHGQAEVSCVSCHADLKGTKDFPHKEKLAPASCIGCHDKEVVSFSNSIHSQRQGKLGGRSLRCSDCHDAHNVVASSTPSAKTSPYHVQELCLQCHRDAVPEKKGRSLDFVASYEQSVHARALKKSGLGISATCITCHGSHDVRSVGDPESPVTRKNTPAKCGSCHGGILEQYAQSIHGVRFHEGNSRSPVCTDCHGEHTVQSASVPSSKVYAQNVPETCGRCHQDTKLVQQFNLATRRVASFQSSFHGIALRFGELRVAHCASCHGYHDILPSSDPRSHIHPDNIPNTCSACHSNAGTNWAKGKVHLAEPIRDNYGAYLTKRIYLVGISGSMGLFFLYIFADLWAWRRSKKSERE